MFKKRNKILIIDDAIELAESLSMLFETHDYEVQLAHNGRQGLKKLENYEPDLILLDMDMPIMGGIEFYHTLLGQNNGISPYPVLVFTGREALENVFKDLDVDGFMSKPFDFDALITKVNKIFSDRYGHDDIASREEAFPSKTFKNESVMLFESSSDFYDKILVAFSNQDIEIIQGIQNSKIAYEEMVDQTLEQIRISKCRALALHLPSMNPLHEDFIFIHKILKAARKAQLPCLLYLTQENFYSKEIAEMMMNTYFVKKVIQIISAEDLAQELKKIL